MYIIDDNIKYKIVINIIIIINIVSFETSREKWRKLVMFQVLVIKYTLKNIQWVEFNLSTHRFIFLIIHLKPNNIIFNHSRNI